MRVNSFHRVIHCTVTLRISPQLDSRRPGQVPPSCLLEPGSWASFMSFSVVDTLVTQCPHPGRTQVCHSHTLTVPQGCPFPLGCLIPVVPGCTVGGCLQHRPSLPLGCGCHRCVRSGSWGEGRFHPTPEGEVCPDTSISRSSQAGLRVSPGALPSGALLSSQQKWESQHCSSTMGFHRGHPEVWAGGHGPPQYNPSHWGLPEVTIAGISEPQKHSRPQGLHLSELGLLPRGSGPSTSFCIQLSQL